MAEDASAAAPYGQPPVMAQVKIFYSFQKHPILTPYMQPQAAPIAAAPLNCPPGLEYLAQIDQLLIKQKVEMLEAFTGFETANKVFCLKQVVLEIQI